MNPTSTAPHDHNHHRATTPRALVATAMIFRKDTVLLIDHRKSGLQLLPGGHLEPGEDPNQAVHREISEELGIAVDLIDQPPFTHPAVTSLPVPWAVLRVDVPASPTQKALRFVDFVYRARPRSTAITVAPAEIAGYEWVPVTSLPDSRMLPGLPDLIRAAAIDLGGHARTPTSPSSEPAC